MQTFKAWQEKKEQKKRGAHATPFQSIMKIRLGNLFPNGLGQRLQDNHADSAAYDEKHSVEHSEKNGMIRLPPGQILRQWALNSFPMQHRSPSR
jgi:hypothetical protein